MKEIHKAALVWFQPEGFNCWLLEWIDYSPYHKQILEWCERNRVKFTERLAEDAPYYEYSAYLSNIENYDLRFTLGVDTQICQGVA